MLLVIIKKEGKTIVLNEHYRKIKERLASILDGPAAIENKTGNDAARDYDAPNIIVDSGLIMINFDSHKILSCQNAFGLHNLNSETRRIIEQRWKYVEYPEFVE